MGVERVSTGLQGVISHNFYCIQHLGRKCTSQIEHILGWLGFLNKLLKDSYIDNEIYEKALLGIKNNINSKEFETIMHLFRAKNKSI